VDVRHALLSTAASSRSKEEHMSATMTGDATRRTAPDRAARRTSTETKHSSKTTEMYVMVAAIVGVLVAAAVSDGFDTRQAWTLVTAIAIGYMVSRGLAKSGSREPALDRD
jgi:hypothetical protein